MRGEMAGKWIGITEEYGLAEEANSRLPTIEIKTHNNFVPMFVSSWPEASGNIKSSSEKTCRPGQISLIG